MIHRKLLLRENGHEIVERGAIHQRLEDAVHEAVIGGVDETSRLDEGSRGIVHGLVHARLILADELLDWDSRFAMF